MFTTDVAGAGRNVGMESFGVFVKTAFEDVCVDSKESLGVRESFEGEPHGSRLGSDAVVVLVSDEMVVFEGGEFFI